MSERSPDSDSSGQLSPSASAYVPVESLLAAVSALLSAELHSSSSQYKLLADCNDIAAGTVSRAALHTAPPCADCSMHASPQHSHATLTHAALPLAA